MTTPTDEHRQIAKAVLQELSDAEDTTYAHVTKEEKVWIETGVNHMDHKNWPLLGDFVAVLRKAVLLIVLAVLLALISVGLANSITGADRLAHPKTHVGDTHDQSRREIP